MKVKLGKYTKTSSNRNISVQIDGYDTYSLDNTLALIILPALLQLKETMHGYPSEFADIGGEDYDQQQSFDFYIESREDFVDHGMNKWNEILDKMIWSFQQIAIDDYDSKYHHGEIKMSWEKSDTKIMNPVTGKTESTFKMVDENPEEHWYDHEGHMLHEERIQEGLELFGKYYRNLWD